MIKPQLPCFYFLGLLLVLCCELSWAFLPEVKSSVYLSPEFVMKPGSVVNRFYYNIDFPKGHIGIKSFNAEVLDEAGMPVLLLDTYLHHWVVARYYQRIGTEDISPGNNLELHKSDRILVRNSGVCEILGQYFGLGSETRKTATQVPDPYAIEVGDREEIPKGYEEKWLLNVHAIDTRGVIDRLGCTECRCDLYNVTVDEYGKPLSLDYEGGLYCCYDKTQCKMKEGFGSSPRRLYLRYTVKWVDWDVSVLPVKIFIFDVTDTWKMSKDSIVPTEEHNCKIEYDVQPCKSPAVSGDECIDTKSTSFIMPRRGYVIYGVAHQHSGGIGSALYRKDGGVICSSMPLYGKGNEAGNEDGYIVGMSTCYPKPGSLEIYEGETLILESNYSSSHKHTGVMGLFYILVADQMPSHKTHFEALISVDDKHMPTATWTVVMLGLVVSVVAAFGFLRRNNRGEEGYSPISI